VREAADRTRCTQNLKQIGLALHNLHGAYGFFPPLVAQGSGSALTSTAASPYSGAIGFTIFDWLLAFIEQDNLFNLANRNVNTACSAAPPGSAGTIYAVPIKTYRCPSEPAPSGPVGDGLGATTNGSAHKWAIGNYAANYYAFGNPNGASVVAREQTCTRMPASFPDGEAQTVFFTERYGTCGTSGSTGSLNGNLWSDSNSIWRPVFCTADSSKTANSAGYPACPLFQVQPDWMRTCNPTLAQSPHGGGINVCMGDVSVRFVSGGISAATWAAVCDPRDSIGPGSDW
jgi:hypothetical protein